MMPQRRMVWLLSLFLVLGAISNENKAIVDAFAPRSVAQCRISSTTGTTTMWSSTKASLVEEGSDTCSNEEGETSEDSLDSTLAANSIEETNDDPDIDSMMSDKSSEDESEEENLLQQIKDAGVAGAISYAAWELAFWTLSVPVCILGYKEVTGHWPDFQDKDDLSKLGAEAFAFVNFARFAVPLRIGLALGTTPWVQENIVDVFLVDKDSKDDGEDEVVAVVEDESKDEEAEPDDEETVKKVGRFRILSRIGNLMNRIRRRRPKQDDKE